VRLQFALAVVDVMTALLLPLIVIRDFMERGRASKLMIALLLLSASSAILNWIKASP